MSKEPKCCKRLTAGLSPLDATLTKNRGVHPSSQKFSPCECLLVSSRPSSPQLSRLASLFPIFRILFQLPYPASLLFAALRKTAGCQPTIPISELISPSSTPHVVTSLLHCFPLSRSY